MGRTIAVIVLAGGLFAGAAYYFDLFKTTGTTGGDDNTIVPPPKTFSSDWGDDLYAPKLTTGDIAPPKDWRKEDPILIQGQLAVLDKQDVSSTIEGSLQFVGEEIPVGAQLLGGIASFLPDPCKVARIPFQSNISGSSWVDQEIVMVYRRLTQGELVHRDQMLAYLKPIKAITEKGTKYIKVKSSEAEYRSADKKAETYKAMYNRQVDLNNRVPGSVAQAELDLSLATWKSAEQDAKAKLESIAEARSNLNQAQVYLMQHSILDEVPTPLAVIKSISKYAGDSVKPGESIMELISLDKFMAEGLVEVQYAGRVAVGMPVTIEPSQEEAPLGGAGKFHRGEVTTVAFTHRGLPGSDQPDVPLIVSGSEDHSVLLWDRRYSKPLSLQIQFKEPVRVVACSPQGSGHNLIIIGCSDGSIYLWDLDNREQKAPRKIPAAQQAHAESITSLAVSPDGKYFASGSDNASIKLWNLEVMRKLLAINALARKLKDAKEWTEPADDSELKMALDLLAGNEDLLEALKAGDLDKAKKDLNEQRTALDGQELVYAFDDTHGVASGHYGPITSLHFTPQCRLVSASRDNTVRVWALKKNGVEPVGFPIPGRKGDVSQLGVSSDGRYMLFDQGKTLQILSVEDGRVINTVQTPGNTVDFQTTAIFSPDGSLLLTAGASEGRLQLWSAPINNSRAFEVRQYVAQERSPVTCAAFSPQGGWWHRRVGSLNRNKGALAVSGTKDGYVYVWPVPSAEEVANHSIRDCTLTAVYPELANASRYIRVGVEVRNQFSAQHPQGRLIPGRFVTIVIRGE